MKMFCRKKYCRNIQNGDLTINEGVAVRPYYDENYGGPKGLIIYVTGTLTNNGTMNIVKYDVKLISEDSNTNISTLDEKYIKRSGVNYIEHCDYTVYENWEDFKSKNEGT